MGSSLPASTSIKRGRRRQSALWKALAIIGPSCLSFILGLAVAWNKSHREREALELKQSQAICSLIDHLVSKDCNRRTLALTMASSINELLAARVGAVLAAGDPCVAVQEAATNHLRKIARQAQGEAKLVAGKALARHSLVVELSTPPMKRDLESASNYRAMRTLHGDEQALSIYTGIVAKLSPSAQAELQFEMAQQGRDGAKELDTDAVPYLTAAFSRYMTR